MKWGGRDDRVRGEGARMPYDVLGLLSCLTKIESHTGKKRNLKSSRSVSRVIFGSKESTTEIDHPLDGVLRAEVSNSSTNSVKRVNNDAAAKAASWGRDFGDQVVPVAMLSGVFKTHNLVQAQQKGLTLFWAHDLDHLGEFIRSAR